MFKKRRVVSMFVALILIINMLPVMSFAASSDPLETSKGTISASTSGLLVFNEKGNIESRGYGSLTFNYNGETEIDGIKVSDFKSTTHHILSADYTEVCNMVKGYDTFGSFDGYHTITYDLPISDSIPAGTEIKLTGTIYLNYFLKASTDGYGPWNGYRGASTMTVLANGSNIFSTTSDKSSSKLLESFYLGNNCSYTVPSKGLESFQIKFSTYVDTSSVVDKVYRQNLGDSDIYIHFCIGHEGVFSGQPATTGTVVYEHYQQNVDQTGYTLFETSEEVKSIGTNVTIPNKTYPGFAYKANANEKLSGSVVDGTLTLKRYYDRNTYKVNFYDGINSTPLNGSGTYPYGKRVGVPPNPQRPGYTFSGWYDQDNNYWSNFVDVSNNALNITARWVANGNTMYKVEHYQQAVNGTYNLIETEVKYGQTDSTVNAMAKDYAGYVHNPNAPGAKVEGTIQGDGSLTLKCYYDVKRFTVKFDSNGGTEVPEQTGIAYGTKAMEPNIPTKDGYDFGGWYKNAGMTVPFSFSNAIDSDLTLYALWLARGDVNWKIQHYKQNYGYLNQWDLADTDEGMIGESGTYVSTNGYQKDYEGYEQNFSHPDRLATAKVNGDGSTVLRLYYNIKQPTVTFVSNGGAGVPVQNVLYGKNAVEPVEPTRQYWKFAGWYADEGLVNEFDFENTPVTKNVKVWAKWEPNVQYVVEHIRQDLDGNYVSYKTDTLYGLPGDSVEAEPLDMDGFELSDNPDSILSGTIEADGSTRLKVYYDRIWYKLVVDGNETMVEYGTQVQEPEYPDRNGYDFVGFQDKDGNNVVFPITVGAEDIILDAIWEPWHNVVWKVEHLVQDVDGSDNYSIYSTQINHGDTDELVKAEPLDELNFGFALSGESEEVKVNWDGSTVLQLRYDRNDVTVQHDGDYDYYLFGQNADDYGDPGSSGSDHAGYNFGGWQIQNRMYTTADGEKHSKGDLWDFTYKLGDDTLILSSYWAPDTDTKYRVEHLLQGMDGKYVQDAIMSLYGTTDDKVTPENVKKNYVGFHLNEGLSDDHIYISGEETKTISLYYDRNLYNVSVDGMEHNGIMYGDTIEQPEIPDPIPGYDWQGWEDLDENIVSWPYVVHRDDQLNQLFTPRNDTPYTITYHYQELDGSYVDEVKSLVGVTDSVLDISETYTKKTGFHLNEQLSNLVGTVIVSDTPMNLDVYLDRNIYKVFLDGIQFEFMYGNVVNDPGNADPEKDGKQGYDFVAWVDEYGGNVNFPMVVDKDIDIIAKFVPRNDTKYVVKHMVETVDGGKWELHLSEDKIGVTDTMVAVDDILYIDGFNYDPNDQKQVLQGNLNGDGSTVLFVHYNRNIYDVSVDGKVEQMLHGQQLQQPVDPQKVGYIFQDWQFADASGQPSGALVTFPLEIVEYVTIVSTWAPDPNSKYQVEHFVENLNKTAHEMWKTEALTGFTGSTVVAQPLDLGWLLNCSHGNVGVPSGVVAADGSLKLSLYYDRGTVKVSINGVEQEVVAGTPIPAPQQPDPDQSGMPGYDFGGWVDGNGNTVTFPLEPYENIEVKPNWIPKAAVYSVQHWWQNVNDDDYTLYLDETLNGHTDEAVKIESSKFDNVYIVQKQDSIHEANVNYDGTTVLKVYYDREMVVANHPDGTEESVRFEGFINEPAPASKPGYTFLHWKNQDDDLMSFPYQMFEETDLVPQFQANTTTPYKVEHLIWFNESKEWKIYYGTDKAGTTDEEVSVDPMDLTSVGYEYDVNNVDNVAVSTVKGDGSTALRLHYKPIEIPVHVDLGYGNNVLDTWVSYGDKLEISDPVREEYKFVKWQVLVVGGAPDGSDALEDWNAEEPVKSEMTVVAVWEKVQVPGGGGVAGGGSDADVDKPSNNTPNLKPSDDNSSYNNKPSRPQLDVEVPDLVAPEQPVLTVEPSQKPAETHQPEPAPEVTPEPTPVPEEPKVEQKPDVAPNINPDHQNVNQQGGSNSDNSKPEVTPYPLPSMDPDVTDVDVGNDDESKRPGLSEILDGMERPGDMPHEGLDGNTVVTVVGPDGQEYEVSLDTSDAGETVKQLLHPLDERHPADPDLANKNKFEVYLECWGVGDDMAGEYMLKWVGNTLVREDGSFADPSKVVHWEGDILYNEYCQIVDPRDVIYWKDGVLQNALGDEIDPNSIDLSKIESWMITNYRVNDKDGSIIDMMNQLYDERARVPAWTYAAGILVLLLVILAIVFILRKKRKHNVLDEVPDTDEFDEQEVGPRW